MPETTPTSIRVRYAALQRERQRVGDLHRHLALNDQHVRHVAVVALSPQVRHVGGLNELRRNAHPRPRAPDAALEHVVDPQIFADLANILSRVLVEHRRGACDDAEMSRVERAELGDHLLGEAVAEELLLGIVAQILKRQDGEGRAWRSRRRRATDLEVETSDDHCDNECAGRKQQNDA
jgi:hypothetical protein